MFSAESLLTWLSGGFLSQEALKGGGGAGPGGAGFEGFPGGGGGFSFQFTPSNADDIFRAFFGDLGGMGGMGGGRKRRAGGNPFAGMGGMGGMGGSPFGAAFGGMDEDDMGHTRQAPPVVHKLRLALEDLYTGVQKKMKITKTLVDASGKSVEAEKILTIDVKPGWKAGTKITFAREGDERPGVEPADISTPHPMVLFIMMVI